MNLFTLTENTVIASPEAYFIQDFAVLLKDKKKGLTEVAYVYFMTDYKSPYSSYVDTERSDKVKQDINMSWEISDNVKKACEKYAELQDTPSMKLLLAAREGTGKLATFFRMGGPKDKNYVKNMESLGKLIESIDRLEQKVQKEVSVEGRSRGGRTINKFEE